MNTNNGIQDLSTIRNLRGYNKAVVRLGDFKAMQGFEGILKNSDCFSRTELLLEIFEHYSGNDYGDYQYPKNAGEWLNPDKLSINGEFRKKFAGLSKLSMDPGFMAHLEDFMNFMGTMNTTESNYYNVRCIFSNSLGYKEMWKGLMLKEDEAIELGKKGIHSNFASKISKYANPLLEFEAKVMSTDILELQKSHYEDTNEFTPFITLFNDKKTAIAFGREQSNAKKGKKFYLLKIRIPEIDVMSYSEKGEKEGITSRLVKGILGNKEIDKLKITTVGNFVFWKINHDEIIQVVPMDII